MTLTEQTDALQQFGYTPREASFLVTAALHSGYFVMRQIAPKGGHVAERFGRRLATFGHARRKQYASNTCLFHLTGKSLYRALGQENIRHPAAHSPFHIRAKLMSLDYVLQHPSFRFLPTEEEKLTFFCGAHKVSTSILPTKIYAGKAGSADRFFMDKYPIRIDPEGRVAFCFVDGAVFGELGFGTWLTQYDALLRALPGSEVVFIAGDADRFPLAHRIFANHFSGTRTGPGEADKLAYFELRKEIEAAGLQGRSQANLDTWKRLRKTFADPQIGTEYLAWLAGFVPQQPRLTVTLSTYELPHFYRFTEGVKA